MEALVDDIWRRRGRVSDADAHRLAAALCAAKCPTPALAETCAFIIMWQMRERARDDEAFRNVVQLLDLIQVPRVEYARNPPRVYACFEPPLVESDAESRFRIECAVVMSMLLYGRLVLRRANTSDAAAAAHCAATVACKVCCSAAVDTLSGVQRARLHRMRVWSNRLRECAAREITHRSEVACLSE